MKRKSEVFVMWAAAILLLTVFPVLQPEVAFSGEEGEKIVELKAESYKFEPGTVKVFEGDTVIFRIENSSNSKHNFTIKSPQKETLKSEALPAQNKVDIKVTFADPGVYEFYCDRPFHSSFGMKGQVEVSKKAADPAK